MRSSFVERFGHRVRVRDIDLVSSGSRARLRLEPLAEFRATAPVARALMRRGVNGRLAGDATEQLALGRATSIGVPRFAGGPLLKELADAKVGASEMKRVSADDVVAVRGGLGMTQEQFAEFFALDVATVRNWEQGRSSIEGAAAVLIKAIARAPDVVHAASIEEQALFMHASADRTAPI